MKKKVSMVDYIGCYSLKSGPVGHSLKVINDYLREFDTDLEMEVLAPKEYLPYINTDAKKKIPYCTEAESSGKSTLGNMIAMLKSFKNISCALKQASNDIVWFYNVDQFLFMYLFLTGMHHKKILVTLFARDYPKKYHNYCMKRILPKLTLVVSSNLEFRRENCRSIYMPDYLFDASIYDRYCFDLKENKVVCVGTMNSSKRILELVYAFSRNNVKLEIYGLFYDEDYYRRVLEACSDNIKIENRYLEYEEYLRILGSARYCVLPYKMEAYENFTSGVLLESMYVGTVPISDNRLLDKMEVNGVGYDAIEELNSFKPDEKNWTYLMTLNRQLVDEQYDIQKFRRQIMQVISDSVEGLK